MSSAMASLEDAVEIWRVRQRRAAISDTIEYVSILDVLWRKSEMCPFFAWASIPDVCTSQSINDYLESFTVPTFLQAWLRLPSDLPDALKGEEIKNSPEACLALVRLIEARRKRRLAWLTNPPSPSSQSSQSSQASISSAISRASSTGSKTRSQVKATRKNWSQADRAAFREAEKAAKLAAALPDPEGWSLRLVAERAGQATVIGGFPSYVTESNPDGTFSALDIYTKIALIMVDDQRESDWHLQLLMEDRVELYTWYDNRSLPLGDYLVVSGHPCSMTRQEALKDLMPFEKRDLSSYKDWTFPTTIDKEALRADTRRQAMMSRDQKMCQFTGLTETPARPRLQLAHLWPFEAMGLMSTVYWMLDPNELIWPDGDNFKSLSLETCIEQTIHHPMNLKALHRETHAAFDNFEVVVNPFDHHRQTVVFPSQVAGQESEATCLGVGSPAFFHQSGDFQANATDVFLTLQLLLSLDKYSFIDAPPLGPSSIPESVPELQDVDQWVASIHSVLDQGSFDTTATCAGVPAEDIQTAERALEDYQLEAPGGQQASSPFVTDGWIPFYHGAWSYTSVHQEETSRAISLRSI